MDGKEFDRILEDQIDQIRSVLSSKGEEYASGKDRLSNFKKAAHLQGETQLQAIAGMMDKHVVSIADMIESGKDYPLSVWAEKIGDNINYLILLKAAVVERQSETSSTTNA